MLFLLGGFIIFDSILLLEVVCFSIREHVSHHMIEFWSTSTDFDESGSVSGA